MKKIITITFLLFLANLTGWCIVWTINSSGTTFSPSTIAINQGDTVHFILDSEHNAVQVSQSTWIANGTSALNGGFQTSFGGGMILPENLTPGTHYYVCTPHASFGMKGTIIVQGTTSIENSHMPLNLSVHPNPSNGKFNVEIIALPSVTQTDLKIFNVQGEEIYQSVIKNLKTEIDLSSRQIGIYFIRIDDGQTVRTEKIVLH